MAEPHSNVVSFQAARAARGIKGRTRAQSGARARARIDTEPPAFNAPPTPPIQLPYRNEPRNRLETRLQTLSGRWLSVNLALRPISELHSGQKVGCTLQRTVREPRITRRSERTPLSVEDLEQLHRHTLWRGLPMLLEQDIVYGIAPVSYRMLAHYGRELREHNAWLRTRYNMRERLVAELMDIDPSVGAEALGEAVAMMRGSRRGVFARLPANIGALSVAVGAGLNGLTFDARDMIEDSVAWRELECTLGLARSLARVVLVRDLAPELAEHARKAGATHAVFDASHRVMA
jgi:hypothetical protein